MNKILRIFAGAAREFLRSRKGNVAMMFGLALVPVILTAGVGVDMARAFMARTAMSQALDAAALAIGSTPNLSQQAATALAQKYFDENYQGDAGLGSPPVLNAPSINGQSVTLSASQQVNTVLLAAAGVPTLNIGASTTVVWGQTKLWVSLVLDNTGSMCQSDTNPNISTCPTPSSGSKIVALKTATHQLLSILQNASSNAGDVQAAIIPFVKDVNVGTANANASWIDWTGWDAANGTCSVSSKHSQSACTGTHGTWTAGSCNISGITSQSTCTTTHGTWTTGYFGGSCNISGYSTKTSCQNAYGTWTAGSCNFSGYTTQSACQSATAIWTPAAHSTWTGCVMDRGTNSGPDTTNNYDVTNAAPVSGTAASQFPAEQYSTCPEQIMSLTYDWNALSAEVDGMVAAGGTNQPIGLVWGWHALSQGDPLNAPALPSNTSRYIIILSDGLNTQDRWYGDGSNQSTQVDNRMSQVCANAKADGITVYAVFVDIGGTQGNSSVLQNCASDSSKYFDLTSAGAIVTAFNTIGQQITALRVSQ